MSDETPFEVKPFLESLTHRPGVYRMLDAKHRVIYVGKARDLKKRVSSYFHRSQSAPKTVAMMEQVARVDVTVANTEAEALLLEYSLIKRHKPRFNVLLRDDKSYPYIYASTEHEFPRLKFHRGPGVAKGDTSVRIRALGRCGRRSTSCKSCFSCEIARTVFFAIERDRVCSTRSNAARRHALN